MLSMPHRSPAATPSRTAATPSAGGPARLPALVCALFFVSGLAQTVLVPLLPGLASHDGLTDSAAALVLALPGVAMLAVSLPAGVLADRFGARRVTLAAVGLLVLGCALQAMPSLESLIAGRIVFGISFGALWTAGAAWLTVLGEAPTRSGGRVWSVGSAVVCSSVGSMIGPALGGLLGTQGSTLEPFGAVALGAVAVGIALVGARPGTGVRPGADLRPVGAPAAGREPRPRAGRAGRVRVAAGAGSLAVAGGLSGVTQLLIAQGLHADGVSEGRIGLAFSVCAVGYIAASTVFVRAGARACTVRINAIVTGLAAISLLPALVSGRPAVLVGALLLTAAPRGAINIIGYGLAGSAGTGTGTGERDGSAGTGSVFGLVNGAWGAATVLMPLAAGALAQAGGARAGYLAAIVPSLVVTGLLTGALPRTRRRLLTGRAAGGSRVGGLPGARRGVDDL
jgi:MFS family permease